MSIQTSQGKFPPPPGLVASLMAGFDSVANHIAVILPPVLLDLFLWLGPHLRLKEFLQPLIDHLPSLASAFPSSFPDLTTIQTAWTGIANKFNLFVILRTFPVGTTSLLSFQTSGAKPVGGSGEPGCRFVRRDPGLGNAPGLPGLDHRWLCTIIGFPGWRLNRKCVRSGNP